MKPYLSPSCVQQRDQEVRQADRTGLIAFQSNKYSVPLAYQQCRVGIWIEGDDLVVTDLETKKSIADTGSVAAKDRLSKTPNITGIPGNGWPIWKQPSSSVWVPTWVLVSVNG